jgi:hypothetical protein
MPSDYDNQLLREAIINIKAKQYDSARRYLERALEMADDWDTREKANFYLSQITEDPVQKRKYLEETLGFNPANAEARKALAILDGKLKAEDIVDADHLPPLRPPIFGVQNGGNEGGEMQKTGAHRFTCPKCGSRMIFDGDGRTLICESCARQEALHPKVPHNEQDFILSMATGQGQRAPVAMKTFQCQGCGAQFVLPPEVISETCSYCGSVYVLIGARELVEPDSIIPMAFNQHEAAVKLVKWVEKHKIIPEGKVQAPRGLYLPIWTFDIMGSVPWKGTIYRNKREVPVSGEKMIGFDDIVIYAAPKLADLLPKIIKDFSLGSAPAYDARYLAGWPAEIYQKAMAEASLDARQLAVKRVRDSIHSEHGSVSNLGYSTAGLSILSFKLVLIPLWVTEYVHEGRTYRVIINGQTGSVYGETASRGIIGWLENALGG